MTLGLDTADDEVIWSYARENGFVIVSKDSDFYDRSVLRGFPPKVVWLRLGNCPTSEIDMMLRGYYREIVAFESDAGASFLILERGIS
jgi:predicted nuclease of predicted toxin-antitoxin system